MVTPASRPSSPDSTRDRTVVAPISFGNQSSKAIVTHDRFKSAMRAEVSVRPGKNALVVHRKAGSSKFSGDPAIAVETVRECSTLDRVANGHVFFTRGRTRWPSFADQAGIAEKFRKQIAQLHRVA